MHTVVLNLAKKIILLGNKAERLHISKKVLARPSRRRGECLDDIANEAQSYSTRLSVAP